jgi:hypothetical protein
MSHTTLTFEERLKRVDMPRIAEAGQRIYEEVKDQYLPDQKGKFLAIDTETRKVYFGESSAEAVEAARAERSDTVFYVAKIGYSFAEVMANMGV